MTIRERIAELTRGVWTQIELDAVVACGALKTLRVEFPTASAAEINYEWEARKLGLGGSRINHMTSEED